MRWRDRTFAIVLIGVGVLLLLPNLGFGWVVTAAVGLMLVFVWYSRRQRGGRSSPWLLAIGVVFLLNAVDRFYGFDVPWLPVLLIVAGLAYLVDSGAR